MNSVSPSARGGENINNIKNIQSPSNKTNKTGSFSNDIEGDDQLKPDYNILSKSRREELWHKFKSVL